MAPDSDARCQCGKCEITYLQSAKECCCCQEIEQCVEALNNERVHKMVETIPPCITQHPGFDAVCLNEWTLRLAADKFRRLDGKKYSQSGSEDVY
ncbi:hypothetical protein QZH41_001414 [Actinostola sp. cb2023]|nr:hypothetical protein QZH41_001414 [Actinostola sp. cb2023]